MSFDPNRKVIQPNINKFNLFGGLGAHGPRNIGHDYVELYKNFNETQQGYNRLIIRLEEGGMKIRQ